jgi:hypothetical protein
MTTEQRNAIAQHGKNLLAIFPRAAERDPVRLCRKLRKLELEAHEHTLELCNGDEMRGVRQSDGNAAQRAWEHWQERHDKALDAILGQVDRLLGFRAAGVPVFLNRDARGYALKINCWWTDEFRHQHLNQPVGQAAAVAALHKDRGGYGIIAPEINAKGE